MNGKQMFQYTGKTQREDGNVFVPFTIRPCGDYGVTRISVFVANGDHVGYPTPLFRNAEKRLP